MLDFHNHLIPGVDDGAVDISASLAAVAAMQEQGIYQIVTTPHLRASLLGKSGELQDYLARIASAWASLSSHVNRDFPAIRLERGFEILLDVPSPQLDDPIFRLGGSRFVLVEFPFLSIPPQSDQALFNLKVQGYEPIVAHPERYRDIQAEPARVGKWCHVGAHLQANAGSFIGRYGPEARKTAWQLLAHGSISYVCSDYHARGICDSKEAFDEIELRYGWDVAERLFTANPTRVLDDDSPITCHPPPPPRMMFLRRFRRRFRRD